MKKALLAVVLMAAVVLAGCHSVPVNVGAKPGMEYEVVGKGSGKASGFMLFQVIPIGQNGRFIDAYNRACRDGGGDDLINVEINERWYWAYIGNGYITRIKGDVIRYKR